MTWVRIDESFPEHPKVSVAGGDAAWLHVCAMCYCNRFLTDGYIPASILSRLSDRRKPTDLAARLVNAGLWDQTDDGWVIHDYLHYQPSKSFIEEQRENARKRMAVARANKDESSEDVRANIDGSSRNPSPSVSVRPSRSSKSVSVSTASGETPLTDDDQKAFDLAIAILVEHKAKEHPPTNRRAWEKTTVPQTIDEDGDAVRAAITNGRTALEAAGDVLHSQRKAVLAAERLK